MPPIDSGLQPKRNGPGAVGSILQSIVASIADTLIACVQSFVLPPAVAVHVLMRLPQSPLAASE